VSILNDAIDNVDMEYQLFKIIYVYIILNFILKYFKFIIYDIFVYIQIKDFLFVVFFCLSYLEGRNQRVVIGGSKSSTLPVHSGVPQGSILGPLLFVIFINDMLPTISEGTSIALYADDTKIWREIKCDIDQIKLQKDIDSLYLWSIKNKMKFHPDKCKALSITNKHLSSELPFFEFIYTISIEIIYPTQLMRRILVSLSITN